MDIQEFNTNLENLNIEQIESSIFEQTDESMFKLNQSQLEKGDNALGGKMPFYKSKEYAEYKKSIGSKAGGRVDLKLTKSMYSGFAARQTKTFIELSSVDEKTDELNMMFGEKNIFGLTEENLTIYSFEVFLPKYQNELLKTILK